MSSNIVHKSGNTLETSAPLEVAMVAPAKERHPFLVQLGERGARAARAPWADAQSGVGGR